MKLDGGLTAQYEYSEEIKNYIWIPLASKP